jgi:hypothetical protein
MMTYKKIAKEVTVIFVYCIHNLTLHSNRERTSTRPSIRITLMFLIVPTTTIVICWLIIVVLFILPTQATMTSLAQVAVDAVMKHPKSNIEMALEFVSKVCPRFTSQDNDRLVKVGRSLQNLVFLKDQIPFESSVKQLIEECDLLCSDIVKVSSNCGSSCR